MADPRSSASDVNLANIACDEVLGARDTAPGAARRHLRRSPGTGSRRDPAGRRHARNVVPGAYRGVAVTRSTASSTRSRCAALHRPRGLSPDPVHRRRAAPTQHCASIVAVQKESDEPLFSPITALQLLVGPAECAYVEDPEVDTAIPTAARARRPSSRTGQARRGGAGPVRPRQLHHRPGPLRVTVREVVPPYPAKLLDQAQRVLGLPRTCRRSSWSPDVVELDELAARRTSAGATCCRAAVAASRSRGRPMPIWTNIPSAGRGC